MPIDASTLDHNVTIGDCFWVREPSGWVKFGGCASVYTCAGIRPSPTDGSVGDIRDCPCVRGTGGVVATVASGSNVNVPAEVLASPPHNCMKDILYRFQKGPSGNVTNSGVSSYIRKGANVPPPYAGPAPSKTISLGDGTTVVMKVSDLKDIADRIALEGNAWEAGPSTANEHFVVFK